MSKICLISVILFVIVVSTRSNAAKILAVFPTPSISHQVVFRPLTQELARRGHDVTVITADPVFSKENSPRNLTEIDVHDMSYEAWRKVVNKLSSSTDMLSQMQVILETMAGIVEIQVKSVEVQTVFNRTKKFDLILLEACSRPLLGFSHIYKAPVITVSSFGNTMYNSDAMGIPTHPLLYPVISHQRVHNLTTWEKVKEIYKHFRLGWYFDGPLIEYENSMLKRAFGPDVPSVQELTNNIDMMFLNMHPMYMLNVPLPPSVISIWGIHKRVKKELPNDIKSYLDSSKHGVIYMSFGTNIVPSTLPAEKIQYFVKVFSQLPYDVLWKWDKDELPGKSDNIRIEKWYPQSDLLKHPKVKLFITQGGLQSTEEAINAGVPMVGVPVHGDQWYNVEQYEHLKIGKRLELETLTENDIRITITTVLSDDSYRKNTVKLRSLMMDEPQPALERAVWWTEHVLRHNGAKHLRSPAANMAFTQYYEIPLVVTVVCIVIVMCFVTVLALRLCFMFLLKCWRTKIGSKVKSN